MRRAKGIKSEVVNHHKGNVDVSIQVAVAKRFMSQTKLSAE